MNGESGSPVTRAAEQQDLAALKEALNRGENPLADDRLALNLLADAGNLPGVQLVIEALHRVEPALRESVFMQGVIANHLPVIQAFIALKMASPRMLDTALQWAARLGHLDIMDCVLAHGANPCAEECLALQWAANHQQAAAIMRLRASDVPLADRVLVMVPSFSPAVQLALLENGPLPTFDILPILDPVDLVRRGLAVPALCALLRRRGYPDLADMINSTGLLNTLEPRDRAATLRLLLAEHTPEPETADQLPPVETPCQHR